MKAVLATEFQMAYNEPTGLVECLQACQEISVPSPCKAVDYIIARKSCLLLSQYAPLLGSGESYSYFELVTGTSSVQYETNVNDGSGRVYKSVDSFLTSTVRLRIDMWSFRFTI